MTRQVPQISDEEARRLWQRAAELQEEAERTASRALTATPGETRLSLDHVTQAAEGAGIHPDFVLMALAEQQLPDAPAIRREHWQARWLRRAVSEVDALEEVRTIPRPPGAVVPALKEVAARPAFNLLLENTVEPTDDLGDRVLVLRLQGGASHFSSALNLADVRVLLVALRPVAEGTHVRIRAPLFRRGVNLGVAGVAATLGGTGGSWAGWTLAGIAAAAVGVTGGAALLIPAGIGALAGGALGVGGFRSLYDGLARQGQAAISSFLTAVAVEVESNREITQ